MLENVQRAELASFLRTRRARLSPAEVGLPHTIRRKTAGLRREEVAQLAGVGVTWYTWLEQGRDIHVSAQVLDCLAHTLRLTPAEKAHLYLLAGQAPPLQPTPAQEHVSPFLQQMLERLGNCPAYITGRRWDVLAWNRAASLVIADFAVLPGQERNIMRLVFTNEQYRQRVVDWKGIAQKLLAQLRASSSLYSEDEQLTALIAELQQRSPEFASWWPRHEVQGRQDGQKELRHPQVGTLVLEHSTFQIEGTPGLKMVVYLPTSEETNRKLEQLCAR
ncbi:XRE family transcriptional regulator [Ktedonosporobacter rubrisoli]|uniref:XRE family transcriptional regulator n=1 Tax=Ktedonosporobacter rubrisoli TaxID=2509675 RepID=A0A4P6JJF9_KTERU|nr:helix-turn-helix transcriptional regulator [Ktedonosporobacter rubrisoli]QBD75238.1 XRE family transcriptional regulator [Ktedonosporobacter rubrisoli]